MLHQRRPRVAPRGRSPQGGMPRQAADAGGEPPAVSRARPVPCAASSAGTAGSCRWAPAVWSRVAPQDCISGRAPYRPRKQPATPQAARALRHHGACRLLHGLGVTDPGVTGLSAGRLSVSLRHNSASKQGTSERLGSVEAKVAQVASCSLCGIYSHRPSGGVMPSAARHPTPSGPNQRENPTCIASPPPSPPWPSGPRD